MGIPALRNSRANVRVSTLKLSAKVARVWPSRCMAAASATWASVNFLITRQQGTPCWSRCLMIVVRLDLCDRASTLIEHPLT